MKVNIPAKFLYLASDPKARIELAEVLRAPAELGTKPIYTVTTSTGVTVSVEAVSTSAAEMPASGTVFQVHGQRESIGKKPDVQSTERS